MLFGSMKEAQSRSLNLNSNFGSSSNSNDNSIDSENAIKIPDATPEAFDFLTKYIYGLNPKISNQHAVDVLYLAKKYIIKPIENACIEKLKEIFQGMDSVESIFKEASKLHTLGMHVCRIVFVLEYMVQHARKTITV